jgi:hypothetical protein
MNILSNLKLVVSKRKQGQSVEIQRRIKLSNKISEQIHLALAQKEGKSYAPTKLKSFIDKQTGERKTVESIRKVKEWWHLTDSGKIQLVCKYGNKPIILDAKGNKNAIEVSSGDELLSALESLRKAIDAGELDTQIDASCNSIRAKFIK